MSTEGDSSDGERLGFEIVAAEVVEKDGADTKHVLYTLQVWHLSRRDDEEAATIQRRYTHFHNMYIALDKEFPNLMSSVYFPKKVLIGNFKDNLISHRSTGFENLLNHISTESKLTYSKAVLSFLQDIELNQAKAFMCEKRFDLAIPILENIFKLLSKVYTDRSKPVLLALCRLLGSCASEPGLPSAEKWAELALYRFEGVSDSDMLSLYAPLLQLCVKVYWQRGIDHAHLQARLDNMCQQGFHVTKNLPSLLNAVALLE